MELTLDQALQKGIEAHKAGKAREADRYYTAILKANPKHPDANHNMAVLAVGVGKVEAALPFFKTALEANASIDQYWISYINALIKIDRIAEAKAVFEQAKSKGQKGDGFDGLEEQLFGFENDSVVDAASEHLREPHESQLKSLVNLYNTGQYQEALNECEALSVNYRNSAILANIQGSLFRAYGKIEEALEAYNKALSIRPDFASAYYNIGVTLQEQGKPDKALEAYNKALSIQPDFADAYNNMGIVLTGVIFTRPNRALQKTIVSLLDKERYIRPKNIAIAAISLLKLEPNLQKHLQLVNDEVIKSPLDVISDLHELPLLMKLMSVCPLPDLELEGLFIKLRCSILLNITSLKEASPELLRVQSAIALQCFTNEYIYNYTEEEEEILQSLDASIKKVFQNKEQPSPQAILALASYKALNQYDWCNLLVIKDEIKEVFIRQIEEPNEEKKLKSDIPTLEEITDRVSSKVRAQYEESPYPRWVKTSIPLKPISIKELLANLDFNLENGVDQFSESPQILIAGCGTGQHSIVTASRFKNSHVTAIDLSLSSLSYAKRKTIEYGITNIEYIQADILNLKSLGKQFDIVESVGVLHHMKDPMSGWRTLVDCLKPGGLMKIGLYGEVGRKHIVKAREIVSNLKIDKSPKEMLVFREFIKTSKDPTLTRLHDEADFYSTSNCRDLIFHVQEHRFTAPQLYKCIEALNLVFLGFEYPNNNEKEHGQKSCPDWMRGTNRSYSDELDFPRQAFWLQK